ncbi:TRCF domain-containing protein [Novosphingobium rhizovicinum]|uniref:Transcription-repair-coupling factor n=1 Tax=Novosphingobium rhizovicinum TaxID=3228928 RepID=A0ABV3REA1_9SPHN
MSDATRGTGEIALQLFRALETGDLLYLADDEQQAEAIAVALSALAPSFPVVFLPSSDTLPGDRAPASPANIGRRVSALRRLRRLSQVQERRHLATIMSGEAAARLYADPVAFDAAPPLLRTGDTIDVDSFAGQMEALGYVIDDRVDEPGEVAVRGDVIDIFPADAGSPARIDLTNGQIAGIRRYDAATQLTDEACETLEIGRAIEPETGAGTTILAHLRPARVYRSAKAEKRRERFLRLAAEAAGDGKIDAACEEAWAKDLSHWTGNAADLVETSPVPRFSEQRAPLRSLKRFAIPLLDQGKRLIIAGGERDIRFLRARVAKLLGAQVETIESLAALDELPPETLAALVAPIDRGAMTETLVVVAAADLLGSRAVLGETPEPLTTGLARNGGDIRAGDVVVHEDHGVAKVTGLEPAPGDEEAEVIALEYAGGNRRLVPLTDAGRIWRYGADAEAVTLDKLDGSSWEKRRASIDEALAAGARELMALAEERRRIEAPVIEPGPAQYERFVAKFPFNETADQARAIQAVRDDLASGSPMDRLVIGDVGYGKTEVALRAAALTALAGYQVVIAAPTTVLVRQHLETFKRRFAGTDVKVGSLSRLSSTAEKKAVKAALAEGTLDIVIGTGAVMAKDVSYAKLGLVVIDEEQRFGTADKKKLRVRPDIHLLAMSATPIPRTLHRAMIGLQQISVIATPPARRQPIRTSLANPDDGLIRTALLRERARGGQSFVVVPRIEDMAPVAERLKRVVPQLDLIEAHGKLPAAEIDEAMVRFADGDGDVLLATNIIEAGLDVPRANTMIVWRADRFGLAQLHQLRGRVGRGIRRGQLMLLTEGSDIAERTMKRLRTLATYDRLGAGFEISAADLDQRGAGDPLADTQAGHMKLIGVDLYQHLFEAALKQARGEEARLWVPELNLGRSGALPAEWIPDPDVRLSLYVRLARTSEEAELDALEEELIDRFGALPPAAANLVEMARIRLLARDAGISRVDAGPAAIALTPHSTRATPPSGHGLAAKDGRWLLKEQTEEDNRTGRVAALLGDLGT